MIPFPTPPAIRKVPDHVFEHIAAAVDPPEVVVHVGQLVQRLHLLNSVDPTDTPSQALTLERLDEVKVLREEAVGMYEVAVLAAGSASALKR